LRVICKCVHISGLKRRLLPVAQDRSYREEKLTPQGGLEFLHRTTTIDEPHWEGAGGILISSTDILPTELRTFPHSPHLATRVDADTQRSTHRSTFPPRSSLTSRTSSVGPSRTPPRCKRRYRARPLYKMDSCRSRTKSCCRRYRLGGLVRPARLRRLYSVPLRLQLHPRRRPHLHSMR
jgi:hypothetical protein